MRVVISAPRKSGGAHLRCLLSMAYDLKAPPVSPPEGKEPAEIAAWIHELPDRSVSTCDLPFSLLSHPASAASVHLVGIIRHPFDLFVSNFDVAQQRAARGRGSSEEDPAWSVLSGVELDGRPRSRTPPGILTARSSLFLIGPHVVLPSGSRTCWQIRPTPSSRSHMHSLRSPTTRLATLLVSVLRKTSWRAGLDRGGVCLPCRPDPGVNVANQSPGFAPSCVTAFRLLSLGTMRPEYSGVRGLCTMRIVIAGPAKDRQHVVEVLARESLRPAVVAAA